MIYYIPDHNFTSDNNDISDNEISYKKSEISQINSDRKIIKKVYQITKNCIIGGTIGFYIGIVTNNIIYYSLIGGSIGLVVSTFIFKKN
jgi:hypothetical protein